MPKFSIIIPVYNAEKTIEKCVNSLLSQSFCDYEIILVDDCSKDLSLQICENLAKKDNKVHILKLENNSGVSTARNYGLKNAKGKYILFIDSDDFVKENYFEVINSNFFDEDLLLFGCFDYLEDENNIATIKNNLLNCTATASNFNEQGFYTLFKNSFFSCPWNKVFKKQTLEEFNILFDTSCVCFEDFLFNLEYVKHVSSLKIIDTPIYYYRQPLTINQISKRRWPETFLISNKVANGVISFCKDKKSNKHLHVLSLYAYGAYLTELKYVKLTNPDKLNEKIDVLLKNKSFKTIVCSLKRVGKKLLILKWLLKLKLYKLAKKIIKKLV